MSNSADKKWLARQVTIALMAGAVSIVPQVVYGMPQGMEGTAASSVNAATKTMTITGAETNNVVGWQDFSIQQDETVHFADAGKNYLNLVKGQGSSFIDGTLKSDGGNVYLINPNGVIFGEGAKVDVGAGTFAASTQAIDTINQAAFVANGKCDDLSAAGTTMDVVNLIDPTKGYIKASHVEMDGRNIRFMNTASIQTAGATVNLNSNTDAPVVNAGNGYVHIGYEAAVNDAYNDPTVKTMDAKAAELTTAGWKVNGQAIDKSNTYMLIHNAAQLQNMQTKTDGNYMLGRDITLTGSFTPVSTFSGNFDGNFYTIYDLDVRVSSGNAGLFANVTGGTGRSRIENVLFGKKASGTNIFVGRDTDYAGVVAGQANNALFQNIGIKDGGQVEDDASDEWMSGGIVGSADDVTIRSSYNAHTCRGGGIVGTVTNKTKIYDVYNTGKVRYGIIGGKRKGATIERVYSTQADVNDKMWEDWAGYATTDGLNWDQVGENLKGYFYFSDTSPTNKEIGIKSDNARYGTFINGIALQKMSNTKITPWGSEHISADGGARTTWRIHSDVGGKSLPTLTAFYRGIVAVKYHYAMGESSNPTAQSGNNWEKGYNPKAVYNKQDIKLDHIQYSYEDSASPIKTIDDTPVVNGAMDTGKHDVNYSGDHLSPYTLFRSDEYDVAGSNFTIEQREVIGSASGNMEVTKEYDGTANVQFSGTVTTDDIPATGNTGIIEGDSVQINGSGITGTYYKSEAEYNRWKNGAITEDEAKSSDAGTKKYAVVNFGTATVTNKNYKLKISGPTEIKSDKGTITPRRIKITGPTTGPTKVYDGTTDLPSGWNKTLTVEPGRIVTGDDVTAHTDVPAPSYASANAGTQDFTYSGLSLTGEKAYNYQLIDSKGNVVYYQGSSASPTTLTDFTQKTDGKYTIQGTITPRVLDPTKFQDFIAVDKFKDAEKVYDGSDAYTASDGMTGSAMTAAVGDEGVISADQGKLHFTVQSAKFNSANATANAGANRVTYTVKISADEEALLKNYTLNGSTLDTYTGNTDVSGAGTIMQRVLKVGMKHGTGIDKEYDGDATVKDTAAHGYLTFGGPNGYVDYASGSANIVAGDTADAVFGVAAAYQSTNGENAQDVNRGANRAVVDKDIEYTITLTGTKAGNYIVQAGDTAGSGQQTTLAAKGKITPLALTLTAGNTIEKTYDGTTDAYKDGAWVGTVTQNVPGWTLRKKSDNLVVSGLTVSWSRADYNNENVKHANKVTFSGVHVDSVNYDVVGADGSAADLASVEVAGKINPKAIHVDNDIVIDFHGSDKGYKKEYDGKRAIDAQVIQNENLVSFTLSGLVEKDKGKVKVKATGADFDNKNAGTGKTITYHLLASVAAGVDPDFADNYTFGGTPIGTAFNKVLAGQGTIDKRTLYATVNGTERKVYDNTTDVNSRQATFGWATNGNRIVKSEGAADFDDVQFDDSAVVGTYDSKDAGTKHTVTYTGLKLKGTEAGNYQLVKTEFAGAAESVIEKRGVKVAFKAGLDHGIDKVYDGDKKLKGSWGNITYNLELQNDTANPGTTGLVAGDTVAFHASRAEYQDENVAWDDVANSPKEMEVYYSGFSTENQNYYIINGTDTLVGKGTITPRQIRADDVKAQGTIRKVYDTTKDFAPSGTIPGTVNGKVVVDGQETTDTDKLVGFDPAQADQYKNLKVKVKKITYQDANVVNNQGAGHVDVEVEVTGTGGAATSHNYIFTGGGTVTKTFDIGTITPANVTVSFAKVEKEYDGNTKVPQSLVAPTVTGRLGTDSVGLAAGYQAAFESEKVKGKNGDGQNWVNYSGLALNNPNYQLVNAEGKVITATTGAGEIKPRRLTDADINTAFQIADATKVYDGTAKVKYGDSDSLTDENGVRKYVTKNGAFQKDDGQGLGNQEIQIGYTITSAEYQADTSPARPASYVGSGDKTVKYAFKLDTENFDLSALTGVAADGTFNKTTTTNTITKKTVTASLNPGNFDKTYDGNDRVLQDVTNQIQVDGLTGNDGVELDTSKINARYQSKNVAVDTGGKAKAQDIYYTAALKGDAAGNYDFQGGDDNHDGTRKLTGQGTINKAALTATIGYAEKTYDGTNQVVSVPGVTLDGFIAGESFEYNTAPGITGTYDDADVNRAKSGDPVGYKGVTYKGLNQALRDEKIANKSSADVLGRNYEVTQAKTAVNGKTGVVDSIADTIYFAEAAENGKIKPLAITNAAIEWDAAPIVKTYDGDNKVIEAEKYLKLKATDSGGTPLLLNGQEVPLAYELASAAYDNKNAAANKAVTYKVQSLNAELNKNYDLDPNLVPTINAKLAAENKKGTINRRLIQVTVTNGEIVKTYDGTDTVPDGVRVDYDKITKNKLHTDDDHDHGAIEGEDVRVTINNLHYISSDANTNPDGDVLPAKTKAGYVQGQAVLAGTEAGNYTIDETKVDPTTVNVTSQTFNIAGEIRQRVVYVDFKAGRGDENTNNKTYDGTTGLGHTALNDVELKGRDDEAKTGVIAGDVGQVVLDTAPTKAVRGQYATKNVARKADGTVTTQEVYYDNFNLTGSKANNYAVQAAPEHRKGNDTTTLVGRGRIDPKVLNPALHQVANIDKTYDGTSSVENPKNNIDLALASGDNIDNIGLEVTAVYRENPDGTGDEVKDAGKNNGANNALGVDYVLKWTRTERNYELAQFSLKGKGKITRRTLTYAGGAPTTTKVYDGTDAVRQEDAARAFANAFDDAVYRKDYTENPNIAATTARYTDGVNASVDNQTVTPANHTVDYTITLSTNNAYGTSNFQMDASGALTDTRQGSGTITRRTLHMDTPAEMAPSDTAAEPGHTLRPPTGDTGMVGSEIPPTVTRRWEGGTKTWDEIRNTPGTYHYDWVASDGSAPGLYGQNYIFAGGTLVIRSANPLDPSNPGNSDIVRTYYNALAEMDFIPDDYAYHRASRDWDKTHFYRDPRMELTREKDGINLTGMPKYSPVHYAEPAQESSSAANWNYDAAADPMEAAREAAARIETRETDVNQRLSEDTEAALTPVTAKAAASEAAGVPAEGWLASRDEAAKPAATGIRINAQDEEVDEASLTAAAPDRGLHIGIETVGRAVNMRAMV